jgi:hypothetical protein
MNRPRITSGRLLLWTGVLHQAIGVIGGLGVGQELGGRNLFAEVGRAGLLDSIGNDFVRMAWFWFLVTGFVVMALGALCHRVEARGVGLPASLGWQLGALAVAGVAFIPVSGFWLILPQAWWIVRKADRHAARGVARDGR